jgi:oxepin-CoA hydrolase / 3-oxo-5,6-dehydrosuberyl-CoA semialdehyde dehydrogenase
LMSKKEAFYALSYRTGATRTDSWVDIEGGIGNLFANASLRRQFPNLPYCTDGEAAVLSKRWVIHGASYFSTQTRGCGAYKCL